MSTQLDEPTSLDLNSQEDLTPIYRLSLNHLRKTLSPIIPIHLSFFFLIIIEASLFSAYINKLSLAAFALGGIFATIFTYVILTFYYQTKIAEQMIQIKDDFLAHSKKVIGSNNYLTLGDACSKLANHLNSFEGRLYELPALIQPIQNSLNIFSSYLHSKNVFKLKKLLLQASIHEHLSQVKLTPTDLAVHASLASLYTNFAHLYQNRTDSGKEVYKNKASFFEKLALEEFKILNEYAPHDPWVFDQLERGYERLKLYQEQLSALEILHKLKPQDSEILLRLGKLYFQLGISSKGLQTYKYLKLLHFKKAEELLQQYTESFSSNL